jgi:hypothetical protein
MPESDEGGKSLILKNPQFAITNPKWKRRRCKPTPRARLLGDGRQGQTDLTPRRKGPDYLAEQNLEEGYIPFDH